MPQSGGIVLWLREVAFLPQAKRRKKRISSLSEDYNPPRADGSASPEPTQQPPPEPTPSQINGVSLSGAAFRKNRALTLCLKTSYNTRAQTHPPAPTAGERTPATKKRISLLLIFALLCARESSRRLRRTGAAGAHRRAAPTAAPTATPEPTATPTPEPTATPEPTPEPVAAEITDGVSLSGQYRRVLHADPPRRRPHLL